MRAPQTFFPGLVLFHGRAVGAAAAATGHWCSRHDVHMKVFCYVKGRVRWIISVQVNVPLKLPKYMGQIQVVQEMRILKKLRGASNIPRIVDISMQAGGGQGFDIV